MFVRTVLRDCTPVTPWHKLVSVTEWYQPGESWTASLACGSTLHGLLQMCGDKPTDKDDTFCDKCMAVKEEG